MWCETVGGWWQSWVEVGGWYMEDWALGGQPRAITARPGPGGEWRLGRDEEDRVGRHWGRQTVVSRWLGRGGHPGPSAPNITYHQVISLHNVQCTMVQEVSRREILLSEAPAPALIPGQPYVSHYGVVGIMDWARWARDYIDWSRSLRGFSHSPELESEPESGDLGQFSLTTCLSGSEKERKARAC